MGMGFAPTWLRQVSPPLLHKTTLTTGTEVAHVTRDSETTYKVERSKVKVTRPLWLVVLAGQHGHTVMVTYPYA